MVSLILPTYKPGPYLTNCLASIEAQTYHDYELIIILNGCKEPYLSKIKEYKKAYSRIPKFVIIQTDTPGVSNARNIGIDNAIGNYLAFIDDDDIISPNYLSELIGCGDPTKISFSNIISFRENPSDIDSNFGVSKVFKSIKDKPNLSLYQVRRLLNGPWGKLYPKKIIQNTRFNTSLSHGEDSMFNFELSRKIKGYAFTHENAIYYYRLNPKGVTLREHNIWYWIKQSVKANYIRTYIYLHHPFEYNFIFFIAKFAANLKFISTRILYKYK